MSQYYECSVLVEALFLLAITGQSQLRMGKTMMGIYRVLATGTCYVMLTTISLQENSPKRMK
jgi:hypothetical protein